MSDHIERLVYMANQIARNFEINGAEKAAHSTAEHIRAYWEPRMRAEIHKAVDGALSPIAARAITLLGPHEAA